MTESITLDDLQCSINIHAGRPLKTMTDEQWQKIFQIMKTIVKPDKQHNKMPKTKGYKQYIDDTDANETNDSRYRSYINSVLSTIRKNEIDYCYYIYQITDLLKYEPDLKTEYDPKDQVFRVWLTF